MLKLSSSKNKVLSEIDHQAAIILKVTENNSQINSINKNMAFIAKDIFKDPVPTSFSVTLLTDEYEGEKNNLPNNTLLIDNALNYLSSGDIIKYSPERNKIDVLYRQSSNTNSFLLTERCNSFCLMCSQPPRDIDDSYLVNDIIKTMSLIDQSEDQIGFSGGEPTLLGDSFFRLVEAAKFHLPQTHLHILSNGRLFSDLHFTSKVSAIKHRSIRFGIPLYSDIDYIHDYVVQAKGAFNETIKGLLNLKRCGINIELRVVVHKQTYKRLPKLADFIVRNLPFVDHVALMGLEIMGFARANLGELWVDPYHYQSELMNAVKILEAGRVKPILFNHQHCLIPKELWSYSQKTISDWKNEYLEQCKSCDMLSECGGLFSSAKYKYSDHIQPITNLNNNNLIKTISL